MQQISDFGRVVSEYDENKHILSKTKSINEKVDALCKAIEYLKQREEEEYEEYEEEETSSITSRIIKSMKMPVIIVVAAHLAVIGGIMITSSNSAKAKQISSDKKALEESYQYAGMGEKDWPKPKFHVVTSKDTFYGLVKKYKVDAKKFKEINKIKDINVLIDGKKLIIP
jgi:LysM repeat protein